MNEAAEISNFARPGHASRHNVKYWDDVPFLGFGMAAHSAEALFTGLRRREGIDLDAFRARYGIDPRRRYEAALHDALAAGIVELSEGRLRLAEAGVLVSNELFQAFV